MTSRLALDHVVVGVADLDRAQERLRGLGLTALPGGSHPAWGTANRIVPLGSSYLALVAVVAPAVASTSAFGSWV
ncbi:MAG: VOC family protein, partial [Candidatus Nanopelagicales bacterium]